MYPWHGSFMCYRNACSPFCFIGFAAFTVSAVCGEARVHLMPHVQLRATAAAGSRTAGVARQAPVVSMKHFCSCGCWCFSSGSWDPGHTSPEAGKEEEHPSFGLSGGAAMRCSTLLGILTGVLLYLVLGAVVFRALEAPLEENKHIELQETRRDFLINFTCVGPDNLQTLIEVQQIYFLSMVLLLAPINTVVSWGQLLLLSVLTISSGRGIVGRRTQVYKWSWAY